MVPNLDRSLPFYRAIGFTHDCSVASAWRKDELLDRLLGIKGAQSRTAKLTIDSNVSGKPFSRYGGN
jgi:hypothetical protein